MSDNIYDYLKEKFDIEVTNYQFKRDYIKYPLVKNVLTSINTMKYEEPYRDDVEYLFVCLNLKFNDLAKIFNTSKTFVFHYCHNHNIHKETVINIDNNFYTKHNIDVSKLKRDYIKNPLLLGEQPHKDDLELLYIKYDISLNDILKLFNHKQTTFYTWLKKYNIKKDIINVRAKGSKTLKLKIDTTPQFKEQCCKKSKQTRLEKYNDENYNNKEKNKQTCLNKYGVDNVFQLDEIKEKSKKTMIKKFGVEHNSKSPIIQEKMHKTKLLNKTYGKSNDEDILYNLLSKKYPHVIRQYREKRYPFDCDFYIPELDLFIEYQGTWTHGKEPYIGTNEQILIINLWKQRADEINFKGKKKKSYTNAIYTWTVRDPLKRKTAKDNGLNWLEFFSKDDMTNWINSL